VGLRQQVNDIEKDLHADLRRPQLNLVGQYSLNGLGGTLRSGDNPFSSSLGALFSQVNALSLRAGLPPVDMSGLNGTPPDFLSGGYGTSLNNLFSGRYQSFQAGVQIDFNFRNRTADALYSQSVIGERRLKLEQARVEQAIEAQIRNALQGIQTARQRITAAEASAKAAKEKLDSEQRLYQTGESTNFLVLTRQNEYADSRRRLVVASLDFNKSVSRLEQALGSTLSTHRVTVK
jgi:HAE1 family hydrophobic/amphiphilic exporter-1